MDITSCVHDSVLKMFVLLAFTTYNIIVCAYGPGPLQDYCVATDDPKQMLYVNGKFCKDPKNVTREDFFYPRIYNTTDKVPRYGFNTTEVSVTTLPGLNTLGISVRYVEYEPNAVSPPSTAPRVSSILVVLKGKLLVGFVSSNQDGNRLFTKTLRKGDVFAFPFGLIRFKMNVGRTRAESIEAFGSQSGGIVSIPASLFGSNPRIQPKLLEKAFQLDNNIIEYLQNQSY